MLLGLLLTQPNSLHSSLQRFLRSAATGAGQWPHPRRSGRPHRAGAARPPARHPGAAAAALAEAPVAGQPSQRTAAAAAGRRRRGGGCSRGGGGAPTGGGAGRSCATLAKRGGSFSASLKSVLAARPSSCAAVAMCRDVSYRSWIRSSPPSARPFRQRPLLLLHATRDPLQHHGCLLYCHITALPILMRYRYSCNARLLAARRRTGGPPARGPGGAGHAEHEPAGWVGGAAAKATDLVNWWWCCCCLLRTPPAVATHVQRLLTASIPGPHALDW